MIKKTINYKNIFTGMQESKTEYFGLNEHEWGKLILDQEFMAGLRGMGDMPSRPDDIKGLDDIESTTSSRVVRSMLAIDSLISAAYGRRMEDALVKTPDYRGIFRGNGEMEALTSELFKNPDSLNTFILGVVPENVRREFEKSASDTGSMNPVSTITDPDYEAYLKAKNENN